MEKWRNYRALTADERRIVHWTVPLNIVLNAVVTARGPKCAYAVAQRVGTWRATPTSSSAESGTCLRGAQISGVVNHVSTVFPARSRCLVRSLTVRALLLREGIDSEVRLGVRRLAGGPLEAHAWVEIAGTTINDSIMTDVTYLPFEVRPEQWSTRRKEHRVTS